LPASLRERLGQANLASRLGLAIPVITVDADGRPHPMLCSYLEMLAVDERTVRLVIGGGSRSAVNLAERRVATVLLVEPGLTVYVKCRAAGTGRPVGDLVRFDLAVEDVLEDMPAAWEEGLGIIGGIAYAPVPDLSSDWAQATLAALRA
jgi:flavin reductase (DIM6/NTAB) family NADH-FMN oxidoreductase RutF